MSSKVKYSVVCIVSSIAATHVSRKQIDDILHTNIKPRRGIIPVTQMCSFADDPSTTSAF